ncbi:Hint domain-containing protein [Candidatus Margulisiibacteriota bacterium]
MKKSIYPILLAVLMVLALAFMYGCNATSGGNHAPIVVSLSITGTATQGQTFGVDYTVTDDSGASINCYFQWLRGGTPTEAGTALIGATAETYFLAPTDLAQFIKVCLTPVDNTGLQGDPFTSEARGPISSCFVAGTKIYTPGGFKNIETISAGDTVYSYNFSKNAVFEAKVTASHARTSNKIYTIIAGGNVVKVTGEHPFYVVGRDWVKVSDLVIGDKIKTMYGGMAAVTGISSTAGPVTVYNISVDSEQNYFVTSGGLLVHNK